MKTLALSFRRDAGTFLLFAAMIMSTPLCAAQSGEPTTQSGEHAHHHQMMAATATQVSRHLYQVPAVQLQDQAGQIVNLRPMLASGRPIVLNFIFTSCTTICPVMTGTILQMQKQLAGYTPKPLFISISIDPDFDAPATLKDYAAKYGADWQFLTGARTDVMNVLKAFDAWRGSKANHIAITLLLDANSMEWTRVEGLASAGELVTLWKSLAS
jgi:protein SCO1